MTRFEWRQVAVLLMTWALCAASGAAGAPVPPDVAQCTHVAVVQVDAPPAKGVVEMSLPPEVFAKARADLADLRLTDEAGRIVPYVLRVDRGTAGKSLSYQPKRTFNPTFLPGKQSSVTLDFGSKAKRTDIDVDTPGTNFRRRVLVEASPDGQSWQVLRKTAWLFRIAYEKGTYSKDRVKLPDNDFRYLRVTVFNAPDDPEKLEIRQVRAWYTKGTPPQTVNVPVRSRTAAEKPKIKATEIRLDLGYEFLPLHEVAMSFEDVNFLRRIEIFGRNRQTRTLVRSVENAPPRKREVEVPWQPLSGGTVHRFSSPQGKAESAGLSRPVGDKCRYLLLRIHNGDNAPLKLTGVTASRLQVHLAFQPKGKGTHRLYFGNSEAARPQYDLAHFIDRLRAQGVTKLALGAASGNPLLAVEEKAVPWSERYAALLWGVLIAVLVVLGLLVLRQVRPARQAREE